MPEPTVAAEIEVKFFNVDLAVIRDRLVQIDALLKNPERVMRRTIYGGEANEAMRCTYGRIRDEGDIVTMSAKYSAVNGDISSQKEAQVIVDSFENAALILQSFGLIITDYQENKRETWQFKDGTLIELEEWPNLPTYIEIEGSSIEAIKDAANTLHLDWNLHTTDSTDKLYMKHYSLSKEETRHKLSNLRFDESKAEER